MRLHVGVVGAEQGLGALDGQLLGLVHVLAAAVVALAGVALGVLVGQHRALRLQHARAGVVLRGDQLDVLFLAALLGLDRGPELGIVIGNVERLVEHGISPGARALGSWKSGAFYPNTRDLELIRKPTYPRSRGRSGSRLPPRKG